MIALLVLLLLGLPDLIDFPAPRASIMLNRAGPTYKRMMQKHQPPTLGKGKGPNTFAKNLRQAFRSQALGT